MQYYQPTVVDLDRNRRNTNVGFFNSPVGQLVSSVAAPLIQRGAGALGDAMMGPSPEEETIRFNLEESKRKKAQDITARAGAGQISPEALTNFYEANDYTPGQADIVPTMDQQMHAQASTKYAERAGFNTSTGNWDLPDLNGPVTGVPVDPSQNPSLVKAAYPGAYDPNIEDPEYSSNFMLPSGKVKLDKSRLTKAQQEEAGTIANRLQAYFAGMKLIDSKEGAPSPETLAMINSAIGTTNKDIIKIVDFYNDAHMPGSSNAFKVWGVPDLILSQKEVTFRTDPAYIASLRGNQKAFDANRDRIQTLQSKLQSLNMFEIETLNKLVSATPDKFTKNYLDWNTANKQVEQKAVEASMEHGDRVADLYLNKIPTVTNATNKIIQEGLFKKIETEQEAQKIGLRALELNAQVENWHKQVDLGENKNAIELASTLIASRDAGLNRRQQALTAILGYRGKMDPKMVEGMMGAGNFLQLVKGAQGLPALLQYMEFNGDPQSKANAQEINKNFGKVLTNASAGLGQGSTMENLMAGPLSFITQKMPQFPGLSPALQRDKQAQYVQNTLQNDAKSIIAELLNTNEQIPVEILNLAFNLEVKNNGRLNLNNNSIKTDDDIEIADGRKVPSKDEIFSNGIQTMARMTRGKPITNMTEFLNWSPDPTSIPPLRDLPAFKNVNTATKFFTLYQNLMKVK